jgi:hypothetical protein
MAIEQLDDLERRGNAVFRGVFSAAACAEIRVSAERVYEDIIGSAHPKVGANTLHLCDVAERRPWMRGFVRSIIREFARSDAYQAFETLFGTSVCFPLLKCIFRYQRPDYVGSYLPYHQDGAKDTIRIVNCWIALDDCGDEAPGVEVINAPLTESQEELFIYQTLDPDKPEIEQLWREKEALIAARFGHLGTTRPVFRAGDAIMFDHKAMHRTYFAAGMTRSRMSIEIRGCRRDDAGLACEGRGKLVARRWPLLGPIVL